MSRRAPCMPVSRRARPAAAVERAHVVREQFVAPRIAPDRSYRRIRRLLLHIHHATNLRTTTHASSETAGHRNATSRPQIEYAEHHTLDTTAPSSSSRGATTGTHSELTTTASLSSPSAKGSAPSSPTYQCAGSAMAEPNQFRRSQRWREVYIYKYGERVNGYIITYVYPNDLSNIYK